MIKQTKVLMYLIHKNKKWRKYRSLKLKREYFFLQLFQAILKSKLKNTKI